MNSAGVNETPNRCENNRILAPRYRSRRQIGGGRQFFLTANDGPNFLRAARALSLHFPPIQRMADVSERIEDLSDIPDADIARMKAVRDAARAKNEQTNLEE